MKMDNNTQKIKLEELEKRVNALAKKINANTLDISDINFSLSDLKANSSYSDFDEYQCRYKRRHPKQVIFAPIFFICKKNFFTKVKVRAKVIFHGDVEIDGAFNLAWEQYSFISAIINFKKEFKGITGDYSEIVEFEKSFVATKDNYHFKFQVTSTAKSADEGYCGVEWYEVRVEGADVEILNRNNDFKVFYGKYRYYLTKNEPDGGYYAQISALNEPIPSNFTKIENLVPNTKDYEEVLETFNYLYLPTMFYNKQISCYDVKDKDPGQFYFCTDKNNYIYFGKLDPIDGSYLSTVGPIGPTYTAAPPVGTHTASRLTNAASSVVSNCYPCFSFVSTGGASALCDNFRLNNKKLEMRCVEIATVAPKNWRYHFADRPNCYFLVNEKAEIYFSVGYTTNSLLFVGKGHQVSAAMADDKSINFYYTLKRNIYMKTLKYNSTTCEYTLSNHTTITPCATEYIEGMSYDYFIKKEGKWTYVR